MALTFAPLSDSMRTNFFLPMVKRQLYAGDKEERYFHLYYSEQKASAEQEQFEARLKELYAERDEAKKKALLKAVENSERSYEEIMQYLVGGVK